MEAWDCGEAAGGVKAAGIEGGRQKMTRTGLDLLAPCLVVICRLLRYNTKSLGTMQLKILFLGQTLSVFGGRQPCGET